MKSTIPVSWQIGHRSAAPFEIQEICSQPFLLKEGAFERSDASLTLARFGLRFGRGYSCPQRSEYRAFARTKRA